MKTRLLNVLTAVLLLLVPTMNFAQAPSLGTAAGFVLFSTVGAVGNSGISQITGNVGTNSGAITGFGNVNGVMHTVDGATAQCAADLLIAYNQLNSTVPTFFPAPLLGNGQMLNAGVYSISGAATLNLDLILNAQGNGNAVFIFKIQGTFSTFADSKIKLINGAQACNVFWKVEGLVSMASGTTMRGTVIANNAAISMSTGDTLEGRALSTSGAVNVNGVLAYMPIGCGSPFLTGPSAPSLASVACYELFSSSGPVSNAGITHVTGDVGTNTGLTTGFNPLLVTGAIHPIPDASTAQAAADLGIAYSFLSSLPKDIELHFPAQFGNELVLTPHTYLLNAATVFTGNLYLNAQGNANAVFVIKINGAFSTSTYSKVLLLNGTLAKNVYWKVDGAVSINDYSEFKGTIVCNNGAMLLATGVNIDGRVLTTTGALGTTAITATMPPGCGNSISPAISTQPSNQTACVGSPATFSVSATGTGLTYQWRKGVVNLNNGGNIFGATAAALTIDPVNSSDAASNYNVVIAGTFNPDVTSINVSLVANLSPTAGLSGATTLCADAGINDYDTEPGKTNYVWVTSAGGLITAGQGTNMARVKWTVPGIQWISIIYDNQAGCSPAAPTKLNITVATLPGDAGNITGMTAVCEKSQGIAYSTTAITNASTYVWALPVGATIASGTGTSDITVNFAENAASGSISVYGTNLCGNGYLSPTFAVTVTLIPLDPVISSEGKVLISNAMTGNQWFLEGNPIIGATGQTHMAEFSGWYSDIVTINGCSSGNSNNIHMIITGIKEPVTEQIVVSPVPNNGRFNVSINDSRINSCSIFVYNMVGLILYEARNIEVKGTAIRTIDLHAVPNGVYTVLIVSNDKKTVKRIIVDR